MKRNGVYSMEPRTNTPNVEVLAKMEQPAIILKSDSGRQQEGFQFYHSITISQSISVRIPHLGAGSCSKHLGSAVVELQKSGKGWVWV